MLRNVTPIPAAMVTAPVPNCSISIRCPIEKFTELSGGIVIVVPEALLMVSKSPASANTNV